jgi:hypothetical protein
MERRAYTFCRYLVACVMTAYGFAKVFRLQFVSLPSDLATPLAELTGQALVWGFFGRSDEYRLVIAVAEIGGGALLLFRRTTPLGALLLFGMLANILLIDILYGISGAIPLVLLLLGATSYILSVHWRAIRAALVPPVDPSRGGEPRSRSWARYGVRAAVFGAGLLLAYSARIQKMSQSTPIDGQWRVESVAARGVPTVMDSVATIYFEQAGRAVLRTASGFRRAKFGVAGKGRLSISEPHWPLRTLFEGRYQLQGSQLRLEDGRRTLLLSRVAR